MKPNQHQNGVESQPQNTKLAFEANTILASCPGMKGKYPNGLADAMAKRPGMTQPMLAKAAGTTQQQINKLVHGQREMTAQWAERLAAPLRTAPELLVFPALRRVRVPVVSWVSAGRMAHAEGVRKSDIKKYITASELPKGDWIALQVEGDSMNLVAPDGSFIFVNRQDQRLVTDAFYVFETDNSDITFKRYRNGQPPRLQPYSTNPDHETIIPTGQLFVIGRVGMVINDLMS